MIVDILVLAVLLISALIAFLRGVIREVLTITGVVGGLAAAYFGGPLLSPEMRTWLGVEEGVEPERLMGVLPYDILADALSYGLIFILVVIVLSILSHFLAEGARNIGLGAVDRSLGFVFGIVRGIILLGLLYLPVHLFVDQDTKDAWFKGSKTHFYLERVASAFAEFIPAEAVDGAEDNLKAIENTSQTRKKLEEINLLKTGNEKPVPATEAPAVDDPAQPQTQGGDADGYSEEFRQKMDALFEEETNPETNP